MSDLYLKIYTYLKELSFSNTWEYSSDGKAIKELLEIIAAQEEALLIMYTRPMSPQSMVELLINTNKDRVLRLEKILNEQKP